MPTSRLYLCRHAEAVDASSALVDQDRFLTAKGRRQARDVGRLLAREKEAPELVFTSPLVRAVQTAEGLAHALAFDRAIEVLGALAPGGKLSDALHAMALRDARAVYLVGHEPTMGDWASLLTGSRFPRAFSKGAVLRLDFDGEVEPGRARARFFLTPERLELERI